MFMHNVFIRGENIVWIKLRSGFFCHPYRFLFWADQNPSCRIERCNLDGSNRRVIVNSPGVISGITIDYARNMIYWINNIRHEFWASDLDGFNQSLIIAQPSDQNQHYMDGPVGLTVLGDQMLWADRQSRSLYRALQTSPRNYLLRTVNTFTSQPNSAVLVNPSRPGGKYFVWYFMFYSSKIILLIFSIS